MITDPNAWLKQYGGSAQLRIEKKGGEFAVSAACSYASPSRIQLYRFALESTAQEFCDLLKKRIQAEAEAKKKENLLLQ